MKSNFGGEGKTFKPSKPFATGLPHYSHILAGTIGDWAPRDATVWVGLPWLLVENEIDRKLGD